MTLVKICGLRSAKDAIAFLESGADAAGMILSKGFTRSISSETADLIRAVIQDRAQVCGVFVNEPVKSIIRYVKRGTIDWIQLHGQESDEQIDLLHQELPGTPIIKAFVIRSAEDLSAAKQSKADIVLLDGGTGQGTSFDWAMLEGFDRSYILAGGLDPNTVKEVIRRFHPYGVDVSSGVETDGVKDSKKMREFVAAVRQEEKE